VFDSHSVCVSVCVFLPPRCVGGYLSLSVCVSLLVLGQPAIAVTDSGTLAAAWDCLKASRKTGVKLIMGCEFHFVDDVSKADAQIRHIILLAKNHEGYKNILLANKLANDNAVILFGKVFPRIDWKILKRCSKGVIATTACGGGILSRLINTRRSEEALAQAIRLKDIFGSNLALEIQPHAMQRNASPYNDFEDQRLVNRKLVQIGDLVGIKVIAATDAHYSRNIVNTILIDDVLRDQLLTEGGEVGIDIGISCFKLIKESWENETILNWISLVNVHQIRSEATTYRATTIAYWYIVLEAEVDIISHNQHVGRKAQLLNYIKLFNQPIAIYLLLLW